MEYHDRDCFLCREEESHSCLYYRKSEERIDTDEKVKRGKAGQKMVLVHNHSDMDIGSSIAPGWNQSESTDFKRQVIGAHSIAGALCGCNCHAASGYGEKPCFIDYFLILSHFYICDWLLGK